MAMSSEEIRAQAARLPWFHSIALTPDFTTTGSKSPAHLALEEEAFFGGLDLKDASLIEIGTWNGYFAFAAKRRGAARIVATDSFIWHEDGGAARQAFDLAHRCLGQGIDVVEIDPTELPGALAPADIMLFSGVFYHMWDPLLVLQKVAALTKDVLILETHMDGCYLPLPAMMHYPGRELAGDATNWWAPNIACMHALLQEVGFAGKILLSWGYDSSLQHPVRGVFRAFRDARAFERYFSGRIGNEDAPYDLSDARVRARVIDTAAHNVQRWLAEQQGQARPPTLGQRLARAFKRG
jgi:tRNA (mo5U34)-methyltransferase